MSKEMISVAEAKEIILDAVSALQPQLLPLNLAAGLTTAGDIFSPVDMPAFDQSSMDGYAFTFSDWKPGHSLPVTGEIPAGLEKELTITPGTAARIFTGAAIPKGANTVVMQEKTKLQSNKLIIEDENISQGLNVRLRGSEIKKGELALPKDTVLMPAAVGFLAGLGIAEVKVHVSPSVGIIVTGDELQQPGKPLQFGQVYESNSFTLQAALKQLHIHDVTVYSAIDKLDQLTSVMKKALEQCDVIFLTGGVSVGDYDFVTKAAEANGVNKIFHKIKQRPGKPLFFGKANEKMVFGLPGNPASVLTCFYQYAEPALQKMRHRTSTVEVIKAPLAKEFKKAAGLTHFLKGFYDGEKAMPLTAQESFRLSSFATANCLIQIDEEVTLCRQGEPVAIHLLPA